MMKKYLIFLLIISSCKTYQGNISHSINLNGKKFIFRSEIRDMNFSFTENDYALKIEYKCNYLDEKGRTIIISSSYKILNDSILLLNNLTFNDSIKNKISNIKLDRCIVKAENNNKNVNVWANDDGFLPDIDTLNIITKKNKKVLIYSTTQDKKVYNFLWLEL